MWDSVLPGDGPVMMRLAEVAGLLGDVGRLVEGLNDSGATAMYDAFAESWSQAIFFPDASMDKSASDSLIGPGELAALHGLATLLSAHGLGVPLPDPEAIASARAAVEGAIVEVRENNELPLDARRLMAARLHDILWAIDHLAMAGPDGVLAATERLGGAMLTMPDDVKKTNVMARVAKAAGAAWTVFRAGGTTHNAIEGWQGVIALLPPGP